MTDMRATERLLEVLEEMTTDVASASWEDEIHTVIAELRRRGDTLVRRDDLLTMFTNPDTSDPRVTEAWHRLENAIGGKL